jgi:hypothetical protein
MGRPKRRVHFVTRLAAIRIVGKSTFHKPHQQASTGLPPVNKIGASTPYDFAGKNLTAYGGLLPVATMLERLGFQALVEATLTVGRVTRAMSMYQFVLGMVLAVYVGFRY